MPDDPAYPVSATAAYSAAEIAAAWRREIPDLDTSSIEVITPLWQAAKRLADDRRRTLARMGVEPATLDLLSTLRRAGPPYQLTSRQLTERSMVTAGATSQRLARAEAAGWITRSPSEASPRAVSVTLTEAGHALIESTVRNLLSHEETLVVDLTDQDRHTLNRLLSKLGPASE